MFFVTQFICLYKNTAHVYTAPAVAIVGVGLLFSAAECPKIEFGENSNLRYIGHTRWRRKAYRNEEGQPAQKRKTGRIA